MSDQVNKPIITAKSALRDRKARSWLSIFTWALFFVVVALVLGAAILWTNRYSIFEQQARKTLANMGIEAEFDVASIDRTGAIFKNIDLSDDDGPFFSAKQMDVAYTFDQVRLGIVDKITLKEPVLRLTLDGSGNLIDSWVPEGSDSSEPIAGFQKAPTARNRSNFQKTGSILITDW